VNYSDKAWTWNFTRHRPLWPARVWSVVSFRSSLNLARAPLQLQPCWSSDLISNNSNQIIRGPVTMSDADLLDWSFPVVKWTLFSLETWCIVAYGCRLAASSAPRATKIVDWRFEVAVAMLGRSNSSHQSASMDRARGTIAVSISDSKRWRRTARFDQEG